MTENTTDTPDRQSPFEREVTVSEFELLGFADSVRRVAVIMLGADSAATQDVEGQPKAERVEVVE